MKIARVSVLFLALGFSACTADERPAEDVVDAAAEAAHQASLEGPAPAPVEMTGSRTCSVIIANGEPHSSLANQVLDEASKAIQSSKTLYSSDLERADLELHLFRTRRTDPRSNVWDQPGSLASAPAPFYVAYVILDPNQRYLAGDLIECETTYRECGERMVRRTLHICQAGGPNSSFKPMPLGGAA